MLDTVKLFLSSLKVLPPWLRDAFAAILFGTMIVLAFTFKKWLQNRQTTKEVDLWACVPVTPALVAACFWGLWASGAVYHVYLEDAKTAQAAKETGKAVAAAAAGPLAASAKSSLKSTPKAATRPAPEPDAARAPRAEVGGAVIPARTSRPAKAGKVEPGAEAPVTADGTPAAGQAIAQDSTAPVAPAVMSKAEVDETAESTPAPQPHGRLAKRLKNGRRAPAAAVQTAAATEPAAEPAAAHAEEAGSRFKVEREQAPAAPAEESGPRFKVERPADVAPVAPTAPAAP